MSHDDPFAGRTIDADWAYYLDTSGTYTPTLTAVTTNPDLGADGEAVGAWHRNGHLITAWARFLFSGSGLDAGSGRYIVSLPFDADGSILNPSGGIGDASCLGAGDLRDHSSLSNSRTCAVSLRSASTVQMQFANGYDVDESTPFAWGEGDRISIMFAYLADPAGLPT